MPPKGSSKARKSGKGKEGKKGVAPEKTAALQSAVLAEWAKTVFRDFPVAESEKCLCVKAAMGADGGKRLTLVYAFDGDRVNVFRADLEGRRYASVPTGTPLFACSIDGKENSWLCGDEPDLGISRPKEEKEGATPLFEKKEMPHDEYGDYGDYGADAMSVARWDVEECSGKSGSAGVFKLATIEAVDELLKLEKSVIGIPSTIIPVVIATPVGFGPDAIVRHSTGWYSTSRKWMAPPGSGGQKWHADQPAPVENSAATLAVFRDASSNVIRSSYEDFLKTSYSAKSVSLDDLEALIPKLKMSPLGDRDVLMKRLEACIDGQLASGDYIVGVKERYWVFRLDQQSGIPDCFVPGDPRQFRQDLPDGNYAAFRYTELHGQDYDRAEEFTASVAGKTLTIGTAVGGRLRIWPKNSDRRQRLIDADKPARLPRVASSIGQCRKSLTAFCAHHNIADGAASGVVVYPMNPCAATGSYSWHVTFPAGKVRDYFSTIPPSTASTDPPPSLEDLWDNVESGHVSIEWYRGAWDNPANPRIFNDSVNWSYLARVGSDAGNGRKTKDPFTGQFVATRVTSDLKDRYAAYTKKHLAAEVIAQIATKNTLP